MKSLLVSFALNLLIAFPLFSVPEGPLPDAVLSKNIKTVQCYKTGWEFSYPILDMASEGSIQFSFDDLENQSKIYNYIVVFCNADWTPSRIAYSEYLDGFYQNTINDYTSSFNTHIQYTHYALQIPNENVRLKLSGNYVLLVYDTDEDHPIFMKRFVMVDKHVEISASVRRPINPAFQNDYQQIDFSILHTNFAISDPFQSIKVVVIKNNQWKFTNTNLKPVYIRTGELVYQDMDKNLYLGGNEYRSFDFKSLKYQEENVRSITLGNNGYEAILRPDKPRDRKGYMYQQEQNGHYLIQNQQGSHPDVDAEYVKVLFSFPMDAPLVDGDIYLWGGFSDFNCYDDYKMIFNYEHMTYETQALIKQGYYNYQYVYVPKNTTDVDEKYFEGSYYETENNYVIYVYYRPFGARYDSLIGITVINSLKQTQKW